MKEFRGINIFLAKIFALYFIWLISDNWLSHEIAFFHYFWTYFYHVFLKIVMFLSILLLEATGYSTVNGYNSLAIIGSYGILIGNHCVGFGLSFAFSTLIASYPGSWKKKLWYIPAGITIICIANSIRIAALVVSSFRNGNFIKIEQHDFFNYIVYCLIFLMWLIWIKFIVPDKFSAE